MTQFATITAQFKTNSEFDVRALIDEATMVNEVATVAVETTLIRQPAATFVVATIILAEERDMEEIASALIDELDEFEDDVPLMFAHHGLIDSNDWN